MSGKWTPGPWYAIKEAGWGGQITISRKTQEDADKTIGDCPIALVKEGASHWVTKFPFAANARLIAAAPELAEALEELLDYSGGAENALADEYVVDRAVAALAKAKGEGA